ncbi:methionyl-tRNA synthetase-like protein [Calycina marina]|uniref:Probable methionine--tRNA ligase, mitochondrial n=1 Tax=Calycina marina TaxID=1763456 RepID=A0A9P7Z447_9HELO|nr:methionyl-tRNA synthetase-like protein [Calycina marina]
MTMVSVAVLVRGLMQARLGRLRSLPCNLRAQMGGLQFSCLKLQFSQSRSIAESVAKKPFYVTTPIFYPSAAPHIGHLYTLVLADTLKRWKELAGDEAILCTGTDEHGIKIQQAAALAKTSPKEFCDTISKTFQDLAERANISYNRFIRTTDPDHKEAVQYFWQMLEERGYIYESKHEGWYCVSDETFYPESAIEKRLDPFTGRTFMASQETGKEVEWTSEKNHHFRLSALKDRLLKHYIHNPDFIVPATRMNDVIESVTDGLNDLSISRPVDRLSWGIRVPGDETQTIYVWLDALVNYITKAGYPWAPGCEQAMGWPADVQIIGKDIVRFHCIFWPAFLMALDIQPPNQILTHGHWTMNHRKMSKSIGNVVNPFFAMDRFGVDVMRFYLVLDGGIGNDSDYGNHLIVTQYKKNLQNGLGNLVSRVMRGKGWSVRGSVYRMSNENVQGKGAMGDELDVLLTALPDTTADYMVKLNPGAALDALMQAVFKTNKYLQDAQPWSHKDDVEYVSRAIYRCAESLRIIGILLQPFMPEKAAQLLDILGVEESRRMLRDAARGTDGDFGEPKTPISRDAWKSLFPALPVED